MNVHFIWWGPFNEDACERIETFSRFRVGHHFHLWCRSTAQEEFRRQLPKRISVAGVDDQLRISGMATDWKGISKLDVAGVLKTLDQFQTFAAVKDLLSLMILYRFGGLYLDTSCRALSGFEQGWYRAEDFDRSMAAVERDGVFRVPVLHDQAAWNHQPGLLSHTAIVIGFDYMGESPMDGPPPSSRKVSPIDVWAMYGTQGDPMIAAMIESYVARASRVGLTEKFSKTRDTDDVRDAFTSAISPVPSDARGKKKRQDDRMFRNSIAGGLIVRSVYDGLFSGKAVDSLAQSPWATVAPSTADADSTAKSYVLPAVSVLKTYGNSWR